MPGLLCPAKCPGLVGWPRVLGAAAVAGVQAATPHQQDGHPYHPRRQMRRGGAARRQRLPARPVSPGRQQPAHGRLRQRGWEPGAADAGHGCGNGRRLRRWTVPGRAGACLIHKWPGQGTAWCCLGSVPGCCRAVAISRWPAPSPQSWFVQGISRYGLPQQARTDTKVTEAWGATTVAGRVEAWCPVLSRTVQ